MLWIAAVICPQLLIGSLGGILGNEPGTEAAEGIGESHGGLEHTKPEIAGADNAKPLPFRRPVCIPLFFGEKPISTDKAGHGVAGTGDLR